jgi:hypothetical protein
VALAAWAALAERAAIAAPAALAAVALQGRAPVVVLVLRASAALVAVAASAVPASMRAVSAMALLVVMPDKVALVAWAELRARRVRMLRRYLAVPAVLGATLEWRVRAPLESVASMEHPSHATAELVGWAVLADRELIAAPAALAALALQGRAPVVVLAWRASAALVAVVASAAMDSMRAFSAMARLVVMPDKVALVAWAELRARRAPTPRPCSAVPAGLAATPARRAKALLV